MWMFSLYCIRKGGLDYTTILHDPDVLYYITDPPLTWCIYSQIEASHYLTCMFYYFFDSRQSHSDFYMMLAHHFAVFVMDYISLRFPQFVFIFFIRERMRDVEER